MSSSLQLARSSAKNKHIAVKAKAEKSQDQELGLGWGFLPAVPPPDTQVQRPSYSVGTASNSGVQGRLGTRCQLRGSRMLRKIIPINSGMSQRRKNLLKQVAWTLEQALLNIACGILRVPGISKGRVLYPPTVCSPSATTPHGSTWSYSTVVSTGGHMPRWLSSSLDRGGMPAQELGPAHVPVPSWLYTRQVMFALDSLFTCNKEQILTDAPPPHLLYHLQEIGFPSHSPVSSPRD